MPVSLPFKLTVNPPRMQGVCGSLRSMASRSEQRAVFAEAEAQRQASEASEEQRREAKRHERRAFDAAQAAAEADGRLQAEYARADDAVKELAKREEVRRKRLDTQLPHCRSRHG